MKTKLYFLLYHIPVERHEAPANRQHELARHVSESPWKCNLQPLSNLQMRLQPQLIPDCHLMRDLEPDHPAKLLVNF